ncbi:hypothetical protein CP533_1345 [Ophiocordyceps camponoti-saundersi (nom. inval.)]|nr:hypothetical protein CP533_1345 [Ophiocordyceps camponoti-saundersi (nom. inval.)]
MPGIITNGSPSSPSTLNEDEVHQKFDTFLQVLAPSSPQLEDDEMKILGQTILNYSRYGWGLSDDVLRTVDIVFFMWERKRQAENDTDELFQLCREIEAIQFSQMLDLMRNIRTNLSTVHGLLRDVRENISTREHQVGQSPAPPVRQVIQTLDTLINTLYGDYVRSNEDIAKLEQLAAEWKAALQGMKFMFAHRQSDGLFEI